MKFYVAVTTDDFFYRLRDEGSHKPLNFWRPTTRSFRVLKRGEPFLFKLHSPKDFIVGFGIFSEFKVLTASEAWGEYGTRNGARSETELKDRLNVLRSHHHMALEGPFGCIILDKPFFLPDSHWVSLFNYCEWKPSIVQGKTFDSESSGRDLWNAVEKARGRAAATSG